ncbi:hypothetical protein CIB48_g12106 [Xylaria polymorpha]|nr:hypothetical protein CIB48_g12106 [Xylaria polymorpha]
MTSPRIRIEDEEDEQGPQVEGAIRGFADEEIEEDEPSVEAGEEQAEVDTMDHIPPVSSSPEPVIRLPPLRIGPELRPLVRKPEILDSEDEEPFSSSPLSSPPPSTIEPGSLSPPGEQPQAPPEPDPHPTLPSDPEPDEEPDPTPQKSEVPPPILTENSPLPVPDIILVTHFSSLLTTLFTHNDKTSAHTSLQLLSSHLQHLAQSTEALIMLLNTTTSPSFETSTSTSGGPDHPIPPPRPRSIKTAKTTRCDSPLNFQPGSATSRLQYIRSGKQTGIWLRQPVRYGSDTANAAEQAFLRRDLRAVPRPASPVH